MKRERFFLTDFTRREPAMTNSRRFSSPTPMAVLLSGGGRTLENRAQYFKVNPGLAAIQIVISDRSSAGGLDRAKRWGIPHRRLPCRSPKDGEQIFEAIEECGAELVILGGFLRLLHVPDRWLGRVMNIHPSLIPKHCGAGYYGDRVHASVLESGDRETGCTVHFVDNIYDHGAVICQGVVPVKPGDTVDSLSARVFEEECRVYPRAISAVIQGEVRFQQA